MWSDVLDGHEVTAARSPTPLGIRVSFSVLLNCMRRQVYMYAIMKV